MFGQIKPGSKVVVAMSGGVDSSVAAAWLKQMGHEVIGITLQLHDMAQDASNQFGTCCSLSDVADARRVAETVGIPFYVADMERDFEENVIENFVQEYLSGRTPNPCVKCNEKVKFRKLMDWALDLGADYLATGHYAKVAYRAESDRYELHKGDDPSKDQSYFLFTVTSSDLSRTLFPVGNFEKKEVRELAKKLKLTVADKPDSQEICFVQARRYSDFIEKRVAPSLLEPGKIIDTGGKVLGDHPGIHAFTLGQRRGVGVSGLEPLYVVALKKESREVVVGPESALYRTSCTVKGLHWISAPEFEKRNDFDAKIRYRASETPVKVYPLVEKRGEVHFEKPQRAITPGQAIVFYRGTQAFGGGWIEEIL